MNKKRKEKLLFNRVLFVKNREKKAKRTNQIEQQNSFF
jgi:hypothetical protein